MKTHARLHFIIDTIHFILMETQPSTTGCQPLPLSCRPLEGTLHPKSLSRADESALRLPLCHYCGSKTRFTPRRVTDETTDRRDPLQTWLFTVPVSLFPRRRPQRGCSCGGLHSHLSACLLGRGAVSGVMGRATDFRHSVFVKRNTRGH